MTHDNNPMRILVVDDEPDIRELLRIVLGAEGWEVEEASSGQEALDLLPDTPVDFVVLDQRMPWLSGVDTARRLVERGFEIPMVLYSAYLDREALAECANLGLITVNKLDLPALIEACRRAEPQAA
jgi:two-component system KDP operon response regulator KdpE